MDIALTKSERVIKHVHEMILGGELSKGDMLPSENELSAICDVSRVTTRKALAMLADMGLIETRRGVGSFVVVDSIPGENAKERSKLIQISIPGSDQRQETDRPGNRQVPGPPCK